MPEIKSQTRWVGSAGSTEGGGKEGGGYDRQDGREHKTKEDEDEGRGQREKASLVKCTLQGLCITCRLQSSTLLFRLLA